MDIIHIKMGSQTCFIFVVVQLFWIHEEKFYSRSLPILYYSLFIIVIIINVIILT